MNLKDLLKPWKALTYPVVPLVPDCAYCAAMRFGLLGSLMTGMCAGIAFDHFFLGLFLGFWNGVILIIVLWRTYHLIYGETE